MKGVNAKRHPFVHMTTRFESSGPGRRHGSGKYALSELAAVVWRPSVRSARARYQLEINGVDISKADNDDVYDLVIDVAASDQMIEALDRVPLSG